MRYYSVPTGLHHQIAGTSGERFGHSLAVLGDTNGDGTGDLAIGAPELVQNGAVRGRIVLADPRYGGNGSVLWSNLPTAGNHAGRWIAACPDRNGDGVPDLLTSAAPHPFAWWSGTTGTVIATATTSLAGTTGCSLGDIDGDGRPDVGIGDRDYGTNDDGGQLQVYFGNNSGSFFYGSSANAHYGSAVVPLGDLDGDGRADWAVGEPGYLGNGTALGRVLVMTVEFAGFTFQGGSGCPGTNGTPSMSIVGTPVVGSSCALRAGNLHTANPGLWLLGFSRTSANGQPLPLSLDTYGFPGCSLSTSADLIELFLPGGASVANRPLPMSNPALAGLRLYCQATQVDPAASGGLSFSDMLAVNFGNQ